MIRIKPTMIKKNMLLAYITMNYNFTVTLLCYYKNYCLVLLNPFWKYMEMTFQLEPIIIQLSAYVKRICFNPSAAGTIVESIMIPF